MSWRTVKLGDFLKVRPDRFKPRDESIQSLKRVDKIDFSGNIYLSNKNSNTDMILVKKGDLLISGINVEKGAIAVYEGQEDITATIHYSSYEFDRDKIDIDFLKLFLKSPEFLNAIKKQVPGGIKTEIKPRHLLPLEIIIPELNAQKEVVKEHSAFHSKQNSISTELDHQLALVKELRQACLREAMQGKLVSQDSADEPAEILLEKIKVEKEKLIAEKKIKNQKPLPEIKPEEIPFKIPNNWNWCRLGDFVLFSEAGSSFKCVDRGVASNEWGVIKTSSVTSGFFVEEENKFYSVTKPQDISKQVNLGDFVFCRASGSRGLAGKSCIVGQVLKNLLLSDKTIRFHFSKLIEPKLIWFYNNSIFGEAYYNSLNIGKSTTMNNVTRPQIYSLLFPLPPLAEQKRIVEKLEKLMKFCDELELNIKQGIAHADGLLQVALKEALEPKEI